MPKRSLRTTLWHAVHVERAALAEDLATLDDDQWTQPSLCGRWTVQDVTAHLTAAASIGPMRWFSSVIGARFDFDLHNDRRLAEHRGTTPAETLTRFRAVVGSSTSPFGPSEAWLGEVVVHSEDIRRPLGMVREVPLDVLGPVATFFARRNFTVNSRSMIEGLRVEASDGPVVAGDGPLVTGTTLALMMAMAGRGAYCDELTGPGVGTLRARCAS
ncbi:hypothetical protein B5P43_17760 [Bacillus sp. SRB_336]|nr:hypothetical protein B5P43_17760 [Bacillus sp. SRB_336]